jgi:two-component system chemotaxis response regulator CheY
MAGAMERSLHVLVIDDDSDVRQTTQWLLEDAGFTVSVVTNGQQGLRLQRVRPADVVVTDIYMPDKDGIETIAEFRQRFPHLPIVVISGAAASVGGTSHLFVARELGAHEVLRKPFDPEKLIEAVRAAAGSALRSDSGSGVHP